MPPSAPENASEAPKEPSPKPPPSDWARRSVAWLRARYLEVDLRWLGVYRVLLGTLLCVDLIRRWFDARLFYTNDGLFPNHFSLFAPMGERVFSIYHAFSRIEEVHVAFFVTLLIFGAFTLGYKTKLAHVLSAVCITSLNARNLFVENGGTIVVNLVTVWTLFLPMGRRLSLDAVLASLRRTKERTSHELNQREPEGATRFASVAVLGILLQWSAIYFLNSVQKTGTGWKEGSSIHYFLWQDRIVTGFGVWLRERIPYELTQWFTWTTLWFEFALGFLLLIPFFQPWFRRLALVLALLLHGGIAATSRLGPFSYVMTSLFVMLMAEKEWQWASRWFSRKTRQRTVIYDADCGFCLLICSVLKRLDPFGVLRFVQNDDADNLPKSLARERLEATVMVLDAKGNCFEEERAIYETVRALPFGIFCVWWLRLPGLQSLGRAAYRAIAVRRMRISAFIGLGVCGVDQVVHEKRALPSLLPPPKAAWRRWWRPVAREGLAVLFLYIAATQLLVNNGWTRARFRIEQPKWAHEVVEYGRLYQGWGMFAPEPPFDDGRFIVDGRTVDGRKLDPFTGKEPEFDPHTETGWGHDQLFCDYTNRIRFPGHRGNRQHLEAYLVNQHLYTGRPEDQLVAFDVWWVRDRSPKPGTMRGDPLPPQKLLGHGIVKDSGAPEWQKIRRNR